MPATRQSFLCDGPLMTAPERRTATVLEMAADLIEADAFSDRTDAVRHLHWRGYSAIDVMILVDDAMQWAGQCVAATEMGQS